MKKCFKCGADKPLTEFYRHPEMSDGRVNKCKECNKKDVQKNYRKNIKHYKNYDQIRNLKRREQTNIRLKEYHKKHPESTRRSKRKWEKNNKIKRSAHNILNHAIKRGRIKKGLCQICRSADTEAHHYDYTKPLSVVWLCDKHHKKIHWWLRWNRRQACQK